MELNEIWLWYLHEHCDANSETNSEGLKASQVLELFFALNPHFTVRWDAIRSTPHNENFNDEVDAALATAVRFDSFENFENLSAGAWRVLSDRHQYCLSVLSLNIAQGDGITDGLPAKLSQHQQTMALYSKYLLGHGRDIDWKTFGRRPDETPQEFPSLQVLKKH